MGFVWLVLGHFLCVLVCLCFCLVVGWLFFCFGVFFVCNITGFILAVTLTFVIFTLLVIIGCRLTCCLNSDSLKLADSEFSLV